MESPWDKIDCNRRFKNSRIFSDIICVTKKAQGLPFRFKNQLL